MNSAKAAAVVFEEPGKLAIRQVSLNELSPRDCLVDIEWTGISTGTGATAMEWKNAPFSWTRLPTSSWI